MPKFAMALVGVLLVGGSASAACRTAGSAEAQAFPLVASQTAEQRELLILAPALLRATKTEAGAFRRAKSRCERVTFDVGADRYVLGGDEGEAPVRLAKTRRDEAPVAFFFPVSSLTSMLAAGKGGRAPPPAAYVLAIAAKDVVVGFRLYDLVPEDARLVGDITAALDGRLPPLFRNVKDKTELFVR